MDEVPLEWYFRPGVKLDFSELDDGYMVTAPYVAAELKRIRHELQLLEIVVVNIAARAAYGSDHYVSSGWGRGA